MSEPPRRLREVEAYANRYVTVYDDEVVRTDGSPGHHLRIGAADDPPGVVILPTHEQEVGLVRVHRYPLGRWQWGLPRGHAHSDDPLVTAAAELHEEMGLEGSLVVLGSFTPDSGLLAGRVVVVHAAVTDRTGAPRDTEEVTAWAWLTWPDLLSRLGTGEYDDGMTMAAIGLALGRGLLPGQRG